MRHLTLILLLSNACILVPAQITAAKLIRHFTFDNDLVEAVNGNPPTQTIGTPKLVNGIEGQAIQLDGNSALVYDDYYELTLKEFTLSAWVYVENTEQAGNIAGRGTDIYWIFFNHGEIKSGFYDGKFQECYSGVYLQPKNWYFLAITYDGKTLRAYINDHLDTIKQVESAPRRLDEPFIIGAEGISPPRYFFEGMIDEVRLYDSALNRQELLNLYQKHSDD